MLQGGRVEYVCEEEGEGRVRSRSIAHPFAQRVTAAVSGSASQRVRSSRVLGGVVETPLSVESVAVWSCRWLGGERGGERYGPLSEPAPLRGGPRSRPCSLSSPSPTRSCRPTGEPWTRRTVRGRVESSGGTVRELERRMRFVPCSCTHGGGGGARFGGWPERAPWPSGPSADATIGPPPRPGPHPIRHPPRRTQHACLRATYIVFGCQVRACLEEELEASCT